MKNNKIPLLSVIIPIYNSEKVLQRCLDSIVAQDYQSFEAILINDGSTDRSLDICKQYAKKDNRFTMISQENAGVSEARNTGLSISKGDYLLFIDSDDFILHGMFSTMIKKIEISNSDICICQFAYGSFEGTDYKIVRPDNIPLGEMNSIDFEKIMTDRTNGYYDGIVCSPWNKIYKKELFDYIHFTGHIGEDYEQNDLINSYNKKVIIIPETFYVYCTNPNSLTNTPFSLKWLHFLDVLIKRTELYSDQDIVNDAKKIYCELYIEYFYKSQDNNVPFSNPNRKNKFIGFIRDLRKTGKYDSKFYTRMKLFQLSPKLYRMLTKK